LDLVGSHHHIITSSAGERCGMEYRALGATGLTISEVGMGTWELGGREWGEVGELEAV